MESSSNRRGANAVAPAGDFSLLQLVQELGADGVPLCREFVEMMLVDIAADASPFVSNAPAVELMSSPATTAEMTAVRVLDGVVSYARDAELDAAAMLELMTRTARYVARFESYLAERRIS